MPRSVSDNESVEDIPFKAPPKKQKTMAKGKGPGKGKAEPVNDPDVDVSQDEDLDDAEDEYAVEHIVSHRFEPDGTLKLEVKWSGWPDSSNTWEPEDNLEGALEELTKYYEEIGGKPVFGAAKTRKTVPAAKTSVKKEKEPAASQSTKSKKRRAEDTPPAASKSESRRGSSRQKRIKAENSEVGDKGKELTIDGIKGKMVTLPKGSWEDRINSISTITKEADGSLIATVIWDDGTHQRHSSNTLNLRCPQKMLQFYESHLQFKDISKYKPYEDEEEPTEDEAAIQDASLAGIDALLENVGEGVTKGVTSVENGIKNVASSAAKTVASTFANVKDVVTKSDTPKPTSKAAAGTSKRSTPSSVKAVAKAAVADEEEEEEEEWGVGAA